MNPLTHTQNSSKLIYLSDFLSINFDLENGILSCHWNSKTAQMNETSFRKDIQRIGELIRHCRPKGMLIAMQYFLYSLGKQEKEWFNETIKTKISYLGEEKTAIVLPSKNRQVGVEKYLHTVPQRNYFEDEANALRWLIK